MNERDERDLIVLARSASGRERSHEAFQALYGRYADPVFAFLVSLLRERSLAEDALQETFLRVYRNLDRHDTERSFRAWVFQIARNVALDLLRRRSKQARMADAKAQRTSPAPVNGVVAEVARQEKIARARAALSALDEEERALLLQRHGQGMKLTDLAESFSCTERTVRNRLRKAVVRLAEAVLAGGDA